MPPTDPSHNCECPSKTRRATGWLFICISAGVTLWAFMHAWASQESWEAVQAMLGDPQQSVVIVDKNHKIIEWSTGAETMFGYDRDEVLGKTPEFIMPEELCPVHDEAFVQAMSGRHNFNETSVVRCDAVHRDGSRIPVRITIRIFDRKDQSYAYAVFDREGEVKFFDARDAHKEDKSADK